jgi:hypothetical protein
LLCKDVSGITATGDKRGTMNDRSPCGEGNLVVEKKMAHIALGNVRGAFGATPWVDMENGDGALLLIDNTDTKGVTIQSPLTPPILQDLAHGT